MASERRHHLTHNYKISFPEDTLATTHATKNRLAAFFTRSWFLPSGQNVALKRKISKRNRKPKQISVLIPKNVREKLNKKKNDIKGQRDRSGTRTHSKARQNLLIDRFVRFAVASRQKVKMEQEKS